MKIALVSSIFDQSIPGGGVTLSFSVVEEWLSQGNEVTVFCADIPQRVIGELAKYATVGKLKFVPLISLEDTILGHQIRNDVYQKVDAYLKNVKFDLLHVHNFHGLLSAVSAFQNNSVPSIYLALDFGLVCPTWYLFERDSTICTGPNRHKCSVCLVTTNQLGPRYFVSSVWKLLVAVWNRYEIKKNLRYFNPNFRKKSVEAMDSLPLMEEILSKFDSVLFPSPATEAVLKNYVKGQIRKVRFPVSSKRIANSPKKDRSDLPIRLLYLGHSHKIKGWEFFLTVLDSLPDGLNLEIIDGGGSKALFHSSSSRVRRYLKASARIPSGELATEIKNADAIVVPSLWHENTPLVVLESLANETPVIAANQLGISHVVENGKNGFLLSPGDSSEWSSFLQEIARNPMKIRNLSGISYQTSTPEFLQEVVQSQNELLRTAKS